jgi:hypothetical protein
VNVINWFESASLFTFPKRTRSVSWARNLHYRQHTPTGVRWPTSGVLRQDRILAVEDEPVIRRCAGVVATGEVDPLDLVEAIREDLLVLEPDLSIRFANRSFCHSCHRMKARSRVTFINERVPSE